MFSTHRLQPRWPTGWQHCHAVHAAEGGAWPHRPAVDEALRHISLASQLVVATLIIALCPPFPRPPPKFFFFPPLPPPFHPSREFTFGSRCDVNGVCARVHVCVCVWIGLFCPWQTSQSACYRKTAFSNKNSFRGECFGCLLCVYDFFFFFLHFLQ